MNDLQQQLNQLKERNKIVDQNKSREISRTRKISIALLTYFVAIIFLSINHIENVLIQAIWPSCGFLLSTLSLDVIKNIRIKNNE